MSEQKNSVLCSRNSSSAAQDGTVGQQGLCIVRHCTAVACAGHVGISGGPRTAWHESQPQMLTDPPGSEHLWRRLSRKTDCDAAVMLSPIALVVTAFLQCDTKQRRVEQAGRHVDTTLVEV